MINITRIKAVFFTISLIVVFNLVYIYQIVPGHGYMGFHFQWPGGIVASLCFIFALMPAFFLPIYGRKPSDILAWLLYVLVYIPVSFIPIYAGYVPFNKLTWHLLILMLSLLIIGKISKMPTLKIPTLKTKYQAKS